jgi:hypothetical protein
MTTDNLFLLLLDGSSSIGSKAQSLQNIFRTLRWLLILCCCCRLTHDSWIERRLDASSCCSTGNEWLERTNSIKVLLARHNKVPLNKRESPVGKHRWIKLRVNLQ